MSEKSQSVLNEEEILKKEPFLMDLEHNKQYALIIKKLKKAKEQRDKVREEFDDVDYDTDYVQNRRAVNTYLRPKKNDDEVRVNTPTTEKKVEGVLNELLTMNLQPDVLAFDNNDNEMVALGTAFTDLVKRTNEIEQDEDRYVDAYLELLTQRVLFMEEIWVEKEVYNHTPSGKKIREIIRYCEKRPLVGLQMYVGDISLPAWRMKDQPYLIKYERMLYDNARNIYGTMDNWKYVKKGSFADGSKGDSYRYRMNAIRDDEVEIIHYMSYADDEYQLIINGIPMYDVTQSYKQLMGDFGTYHITAVCPKPIAIDFFYGRSLVASAKVIQALDNETFRNIIRKFRQAIEPPVGTKAGKIFSRDIWNAGSVSQGVSSKDFELLINHQGVTSGEMGILNMIEKKTQEFIGTADTSTDKTHITAKAIIAAQREAIKMLGLSMIAVMRLKKNLTFLRIQNILWNHTKPIGRKYNGLDKVIDDIYQKFTVNGAELEGSKKGKKIIQFNNKNLSEEDKSSVYQWEEKESNRIGEPVRYININVKKLRDMRVNWFASVINKERDSSELSKAMFSDKIENLFNISKITRRNLSADRIIEEAERLYQAKNMFEKSPATPPGGISQTMPGVAPGAGGGVPADQIKKSETEGTIRKPSINTMMGGMASR